MTRRIGAAILMLAAFLPGRTTIAGVAATSLPIALQQPQAERAADRRASFRLSDRSRREARAYDRTDYPYYDDRPRQYAPKPFVPFNFGAGFDR